MTSFQKFSVVLLYDCVCLFVSVCNLCTTRWCRYGSTLIIDNKITFVELMTAMLSLMLGALGLGQALNDLGDQKEGLEAAGRVFHTVAEGKVLG